MPAAEALAKKIIANGPVAVKYTMEAIERGIECRKEGGLFLEATTLWTGLRDGRYARRNEKRFWKTAAASSREVKDGQEVN